MPAQESYPPAPVKRTHGCSRAFARPDRTVPRGTGPLRDRTRPRAPGSRPRPHGSRLADVERPLRRPPRAEHLPTGRDQRDGAFARAARVFTHAPVRAIPSLTHPVDRGGALARARGSLGRAPATRSLSSDSEPHEGHLRRRHHAAGRTGDETDRLSRIEPRRRARRQAGGPTALDAADARVGPRNHGRQRGLRARPSRTPRLHRERPPPLRPRPRRRRRRSGNRPRGVQTPLSGTRRRSRREPVPESTRRRDPRVRPSNRLRRRLTTDALRAIGRVGPVGRFAGRELLGRGGRSFGRSGFGIRTRRSL